jgi:hypothetical protein
LLLSTILLAALVVAVTASKGEPAARPVGPAPKAYPRHPGWNTSLEARARYQRSAAAHYLGVYRSFLRVTSSGTAYLSRLPGSRRCPAADAILPARVCWYASAWSWTIRELSETEEAIAAVKAWQAEKARREQEAREARAWRSVNRDWQTAVAYAQRYYPGTQSWLLSCSAAEGGHGPWVWYGGRTWAGHHIGDDFLGMDTVGGWLQFRFSTFAPYFDRMAANLRGRGIKVPDFGPGRYDAWLNPLAQALTGGYMRWSGQDGHHWSASWGRGC